MTSLRSRLESACAFDVLAHFNSFKSESELAAARAENARIQPLLTALIDVASAVDDWKRATKKVRGAEAENYEKWAIECDRAWGAVDDTLARLDKLCGEGTKCIT